MKMGNVIEILRKIKWLKSEYSKKKLSKERRLKSLLKNEYFKVSLNEVSRDLRLNETEKVQNHGHMMIYQTSVMNYSWK